MTAYFLALALIGLLAARQIKRWRDEDDMAAVDAILTAWAKQERRKRNALGQFKRKYGRFTISPQ